TIGIFFGLPHAIGVLSIRVFGPDNGQPPPFIDKYIVGFKRLCRWPWPIKRPLVMLYSTWMRLPSTSPQPAFSSAGSISSNRVCASFIVFTFSHCRNQDLHD